MDNPKPQEIKSGKVQVRYHCKACHGTGRVIGTKKIQGQGKGMGSTYSMCPDCDSVGWVNAVQGVPDQFTTLKGFYKRILDRMFEYDFAGRKELIAQMTYATMLSNPNKDGYDIVEFLVTSGPRAHVESRVPIELHAHDKDGVFIFILLFVDDGKLHLLDMYKADGSRIVELPLPESFTRIVYKSGMTAA